MTAPADSAGRAVPMEAAAAMTWLHEAARYFERRDTGGEDMAFWANVGNADACRRIAALIADLTNEGRGDLPAAAPDTLDIPKFLRRLPP